VFENITELLTRKREAKAFDVLVVFSSSVAIEAGFFFLEYCLSKRNEKHLENANSFVPQLKTEYTNIETRTFEFLASQELLIPEDLKIHYYISSNQFHKMMDKLTNPALPKKNVVNLCDAIESITYIQNEKLQTEYAWQKEVFKQHKKVDKNGVVREMLLFHGTSDESIKDIINNNFHIDCQGRKEKM
jgi:hypothetical protein